jgi:hypothetical protein
MLLHTASAVAWLSPVTTTTRMPACESATSKYHILKQTHCLCDMVKAGSDEHQSEPELAVCILNTLRFRANFEPKKSCVYQKMYQTLPG